MKKIVVFFSLILANLTSCKQDDSKYVVTNESSGIINNVSIIIDNKLWDSEVGDTIRYKLAAEAEGLPQAEPIFNLVQYPINIFKGFMKNSRNIVIVRLDDKDSFSMEKNRFATPQNVIFISAKSKEGLIKYFEKHSDTIIKTIQKTEILEKQRRIRKSVLSESKLLKEFQLSIKIPSAYKYVTEKKDFFWIKKEIPSGNCSLLVYQLPLNALKKDSSVINNIVKMRDSIGKQFIHGTLENTYMVTEAAYAPYLYKKTISGKPCYQTKGTWELRNDFMGGPFINYTIIDQANNRILVLEGFVYAPAKTKRDLIQELDAIILTSNIKNKK